MRLSDDLQRELEERLLTIATERESDPAYRNLPAFDEWAFRLLVLGSVLMFMFL